MPALPTILAAILGLTPVGASARPEVAERQKLREARHTIRDIEAQALDALALRLEQDGHPDRASAVRALIEPTPPPDGPRRFDPLPEIVPATGPEPEPPLADEVAAARGRAAGAYADLADRAFEAGRLALADSCLREVLRRRPDDPEARRVLGYVPHEGGWATPHAVLRLKNGDVPHPSYGWIPADWLPHLDLGLLPAPRTSARASLRWIPAAEADASRQGRIASGWTITTPHFKIQASVPLAEGVDFARRLEGFYDLFTSVAADLIGPERHPLSQLRRSPGATAPPNAAKHLVSYFGTKDQYVETLTRLLRDPGIKDTLGIYLDDRKTSYFFNDEGGQLDTEATLYHEVSHQLLFELAGPSGYHRNTGNFWVFEGLGTYFETVAYQDDGSFLYGGRVGPRIARAREHAIERDDLIPIEHFVALDRGPFIGDDGGDPHLHYAQAIALAVFLMDHSHAAHRDAFLDYAADAYRGRLRGGSSPTLSSHVGLPNDTLDRSLRSFLAGSIEADAVADQ